ncbi:MAG: hypothetical protein GYB39_06555 [Algicola sp.]|nr:hypothetical protein [Algicola sp.]
MKKKQSFLFISCDEAKLICDKAQYKEASFLEKVKLNFRYVWCRITRTYVCKNKKLTQAIERSQLNCLNTSEKQNLQQQFKQALKKQQ